MALAFSNIERFSVGDRVGILVDVALDNSYPAGGYPLTLSSVGLLNLSRLILTDEPAGYNLDVNYTDLKLLILNSTGGTFVGSALAGHTHTVTPTGTNSAPALQTVVDEVVSVTAGTGVSAALANIPVGAIENVYVTAGGVTGVFQIVPAGVSGTTLVSVDHTTGVLQFLIADAVTSATVTYVRSATTVPVFTGDLDVTSSTSGGTPAGTITGGASSEVTPGTDLSTITLKLFLLGR